MILTALLLQVTPVDSEKVEEKSTVVKESGSAAEAPTAAIEATEPKDSRPVLWDKVRAEMTIAEVRALYPKQRGKIKHHKMKQTEIEDVEIIAGCEAEVEIQHKSGKVDAVKVKGKGSIAGRCSDKVLSALSAKYGQPNVQRERGGSILAREGEISVWNRGNVIMRFKQFTNGAFGGGGLGAASWELTYTGFADGSDIKL